VRRAAVALAFATAAACVPASEEHPAAGAAGFETSPSPQTQGETFTTADGWNLTVEKLFIQMSVSASPVNLGYGTSEPYVFDAQKPARIFARALPVGPARVTATFYGRYIGYSDNDYFDRVERINVDDDTNARFNRLPDEGQESEYTPGPSVLLVVRAERDGRVVTLDMALNVTSSIASRLDQYFGDTVDVQEDTLASVSLPINAETFFPVFEDVAASDANGDGEVTAQELEASRALSELEVRISAGLVR
jgi:hypothetical protein